MIKLVVLWSRPADEAGFDSHYLSVHAALARTLPGLLSLETGRADKGDTFRVAQLAFADSAALRAAMTSQIGAGVVADAKMLEETFGVTSSSFAIAVDA